MNSALTPGKNWIHVIFTCMSKINNNNYRHLYISNMDTMDNIIVALPLVHIKEFQLYGQTSPQRSPRGQKEVAVVGT